MIFANWTPHVSHGMWHSGGRLVRINEHLALIPVGVSVNGSILRPKDALPIAGHKSGEAAVECLKQLAEILQIQLPNMGTYLPHRLFTCNGHLLKHTRKFAKSLAAVAYCRIVDKGPGSL